MDNRLSRRRICIGIAIAVAVLVIPIIWSGLGSGVGPAQPPTRTPSRPTIEEVVSLIRASGPKTADWELEERNPLTDPILSRSLEILDRLEPELADVARTRLDPNDGTVLLVALTGGTDLDNGRMVYRPDDGTVVAVVIRTAGGRDAFDCAVTYRHEVTHLLDAESGMSPQESEHPENGFTMMFQDLWFIHRAVAVWGIDECKSLLPYWEWRRTFVQELFGEAFPDEVARALRRAGPEIESHFAQGIPVSPVFCTDDTQSNSEALSK